MSAKKSIPRPVKICTFMVMALLMIFNVNKTEAAPIKTKSSTPSALIECRYPTSYEVKVFCQHIEKQILSVTIRIEMQGWFKVGGQRLPLTHGGKSHATILAGRYLLTHNHFGYSLTNAALPDGAGYTGISLRTTDGRLLLDNAPLSVFKIVYQEKETLVLDFVDQNGIGLFDLLGLPSAPVMDWRLITWQTNMELAHIDWDDTKAHIDWVVVEQINTNSTTPHIEVDNYATKGASGGGVFWQGYHVGNVWARNLEKDPQTGAVTRLYTLLALDPAVIADMSSP